MCLNCLRFCSKKVLLGKKIYIADTYLYKIIKLLGNRKCIPRKNFSTRLVEKIISRIRSAYMCPRPDMSRLIALPFQYFREPGHLAILQKAEPLLIINSRTARKYNEIKTVTRAGIILKNDFEGKAN